MQLTQHTKVGAFTLFKSQCEVVVVIEIVLLKGYHQGGGVY